jgi:transcriptional regulator with XRE-family HTH domain
MDVGKILVWYRETHRLTQEQLAERLDVGPKTVLRWENNNPPLRNIAELYRVSDVLGIPPASFGLQPFRARTPQEIDSIVGHVWSLMPQARYIEARTAIEGLLKDIRICKADSELLRALTRAHHIAGHVIATNTRTSEIGLVIQHFQEMEEIARSINDQTLLNIALTYHGDMLRRKGDVYKAIQYLEGARDNTPEADLASRGNNAQLLSRVYLIGKDLKGFDREIKISEELAHQVQGGTTGGSYSLGTVYEEYGKSYSRLGDMNLGLKYLDLANEALPKTKRWEIVLKASRSEALIRGGELKEGLKLAKEATLLAQAHGHLRLLERIQGVKQYLNEQAGKYIKATSELGEALDGPIEY